MEKTTSSGGIVLAGVLTIVFIVLKLIGVINWSWLWALSPIWISILVGLVFAAIAIIALGIAQRRI